MWERVREGLFTMGGLNWDITSWNKAIVISNYFNDRVAAADLMQTANGA